jgi:hypothetical protein
MSELQIDEHEVLYREAWRCLDSATGCDCEWLQWLEIHQPRRWDALAETAARVAVAREQRVPIREFSDLLALLIEAHLRAFTVWLQRDKEAPAFPSAWKN